VDDELIAFSVLDMLPSGISSVYLVWDTRWAKHGLGRLAALREIAWIQEWKGTHLKFSHEFDWYYLGQPCFSYTNLLGSASSILQSARLLGFYIHSCPKMTYKGEYSPSFLLDPVSVLNPLLPQHVLPHRDTSRCYIRWAFPHELFSWPL
jgi:arginine-tRNA-protein transferase